MLKLRATLIVGAVTIAMAGCAINAPGSSILPSGAASTSVASRIVSAVRVAPDSTVITAGSAKDMTASVAYTDGTYDGSVTWSSTDDSIVTINPTTGKVSAVKAGVASIVAASIVDPTKKANVTVTVSPQEVVEAFTSITPKEATLKVGDTLRLQATVRMSNGTESPNLIWNSDNKTIAVVSNGLVTAVAPGQTNITATAAGDATKSAAATITVVAK